MRVGIGYDIHRHQEGRPLILGGVTFPGERGLAGHSDADVLLHAIIDAVLGAAGLGDIGRHFPPDDPAYRDADSRGLLAEAVKLVAEAGYRPQSLDATVVAE
ncbi:MAG: 2-C-methyl-D-erythritol 2,4-cyclodiphosphate synthase, partial [Chloroflexi bacterium]|nr:2-C-methyl-D-erythritol 2,4-cyclodiphosphate synthase [Chloroflexota bacterium]